MKTAGYILSGLGGLMILGSINNAINQYDLRDLHDLKKFIGGLAVSVFILAMGLVLVKKAK